MVKGVEVEEEERWHEEKDLNYTFTFYKIIILTGLLLNSCLMLVESTKNWWKGLLFNPCRHKINVVCLSTLFSSCSKICYWLTKARPLQRKPALENPHMLSLSLFASSFELNENFKCLHVQLHLRDQVNHPPEYARGKSEVTFNRRLWWFFFKGVSDFSVNIM